MPLRLHAIVHHELTAHTQPVGSLARLDLNHGVGLYLPEHVLLLARLNVEPALEQVDRAKGTHARLPGLDSGQMIRTCCLRKS